METSLTLWPLFVLLCGVALVVILITVLRVHAFIALILSAITVGLLSTELPESETLHHSVQAVELTMVEFGAVAGQIAWVIALAAILGVALTESGAAERIVDRFTELFHERHAPLALLAGSFVLSVPVFFDTVFFLLIPIAYSMGRRISGSYLLFVLAVCCGAVVTHSLVPPTPGPLIMAETLELNLGGVIAAGLLSALLPVSAGYLFAVRLGKRMTLNLPELLADERPEEKRDPPSFLLSILPIVVPVVLILFDSISELVRFGPDSFWVLMGFLGNKNIAMLAGTVIALSLLARQKRWSIRRLGEVMQSPLEIAGLIILITGAGGAFGAMIRHAGIGETIRQLAGMGYEINLIVLAWFIASGFKIAQGSGTVAMITAAAIMMGLLEASGPPPFHPVYILIAIGYGSMTISWMNDSGFWVVGKLSGLTEKETLKTWTLLLVVISVTGLVQTVLLARLLPLN